MTALLMLDLETTGLTNCDTILECAWTICDLDGAMRLPLRSRFCQIARYRPVVPLQRSAIQEPVWDDTNPEAGDEVALRMAVDSGLFDAWLACPDLELLKTGPELERLLLDDIAAVCGPGEAVHIGGSGVAQFDHPLLRFHCPGVVFPQGKSGGPVHYRAVDQSVALTGLTGLSNHGMTSALIGWYLQQGHGDDPMVTVACAPRPQYAYGDDEVMAWLTGERGKHRAAPDVARAVVAQRALWTYGKHLRQDLVP